MSRIKEQIEDFEIKLERVAKKIKISKTKVQNANAGGLIVFKECLCGTGKIVSYDLTLAGQNPANIVVKLDNVAISSTSGLMAYGEFLLKDKKLYNFSVECSGEGLVSGKLRFESVDLKLL